MKLKPAAGWLMGAGLLALGFAGSWRSYQKATAVYLQVTLFQGGKATKVKTSRKTVAEVLEEQKIALKPQDVIVPSLSTPVKEEMEIDLGLVERRVKQYKKKTAHPVHVEYTDNLNTGEIIDVQPGKDGLAELETETFFLNGEEAFEKVLKSKTLVPAKEAKVIEGTSLRQKLYRLSKRARVWKTMTMEASAYYPGPEDTWPYATGYTASGLKAGYGVAAIDSRVIKLKTPLYIEGYGYAIAADRGGAIKGHKIDLCFDTYEEAVQFGRKKIKVYLLR